MCNLQKRLIRSAFWVLLAASDVYERLKTNAKAIKIALLGLPTIYKEIYNSVEHLQRQQFSFTKPNEYLGVSKNPQVFYKLKDKIYNVLSRRFPGVCCFQRWTRDKKIRIQHGEKQKRCHPKSDNRLWQATHFSTKNPINKPAMNKRRLFIAAVFHFVHSVEKDS